MVGAGLSREVLVGYTLDCCQVWLCRVVAVLAEDPDQVSMLKTAIFNIKAVSQLRKNTAYLPACHCILFFQFFLMCITM